MGRFGRRPSHATVVAYVALFAALATGGAFAASKIGAGDIKEDAVRSKHIKEGQVKEIDIRDAAVTAAKLAPEAVDVARRIDYRFANTGGNQQFEDILALDGLHVEALCNAYFTGDYHSRIQIRVYTTAPDATVGWSFVRQGGEAEAGRVALAENGDHETAFDAETPDGGSARATGTLVYRQDGPTGDADSEVISVPLTIAAQNTGGSSTGFCAAEGTATRATEPGLPG